MKKRILSLFIAAIMILSLIPVIAVPASADPVPASIAGAWGEFWKAELSGKELTGLDSSVGLENKKSYPQMWDGKYGAGVSTNGLADYEYSVYLDTDGQLKKVTSTETDRGEYFGFIGIRLRGASTLTSFSILASDDDGDFTGGWMMNAFDILYSEDGIHWTLAKSFTGMSNTSLEAQLAAGWVDSGKTSPKSNTIYAAKTTFDSVTARYIAIAVKEGISAAGKNKKVYLEEVEVVGTTTLAAAPVYEAGNFEELIDALLAHNASADKTSEVIKLTDDIVVTHPDVLTSFDRYIYGTFDGQGHTVYNIRGSFIWANGTCTIKNFTASNKTAPDGEVFNLSGQVALLGTPDASEIPAEATVILENIINERSLIGSSNATGAFLNKTTNCGKIIFRNCVNKGDYLQSPDPSVNNSYYGNNHKIGGFIGTITGGEVVFENCLNTGKITASQAGGFVGVYSGACTLKLTDCSNTGTITGMAGNKAYGMAGGLIGGMNNGGDEDGNTVKLIRCVNTGDILNVNQGSKSYGIGGLIGSAGTGTGEQTRITITNCAVYGCTINTDGISGMTAAPLVGKCSPKDSETFKITATACYVSDVNVIGGKARKLIGVGSCEVADAVYAYNCVLNNVTEDGSAEWNDDAYASVKVRAKATADNGAIDTDTLDLISKGTDGFAQKSTDGDKVRFIATISEDTFASGNIVKVGFLVTAKTAEGDEYGWNLSGTTLYTSLKANGMETWTPDNGDAYIFAATITDIPADTNGEFYATPYLVAADGSMIFGSTGTLVLGSGLPAA